MHEQNKKVNKTSYELI